MEKLGITWESVRDCVSHSYEGIYNSTDMNDIFEEDRQQLLKYGITLTPAIVINGHPYRNELTGEAIFSQICQSYPVGKAPELCSEGYDLGSKLGELSDFVQPNGHFPSRVVMIIFGVFLFNIIAIFYLTKRQESQQKRLQNEVQLHVDKYFKL